jgi:hypothetical protein
VSREERAELAGTATRADAWLLLENTGPWGERAVEENDLPPAVNAWLAAQTEALGSSLGKVRPLFIRQEGPRRRTGVVCYLAIAQERRRELYRLEAATHDALAALDVAAMLDAGDLAHHRVEGRLTLVCGNGRRDRCCARWGPATYRELVARIGDEAWLSTHQGGHRYAGTGLWLPEGVAYGFLAPNEASALVASRDRGEVHVPCLRGRTFHRPQAQAADVFLRRARGNAALDPWQLVEAVEGPAAEWRVVFESERARHVVRLLHGNEEALVSCGPPKVKPIDRFTALSIESEELV